MINFEQRHLLHQFTLLELAIKSLQTDYTKTEQFKMKNVFLPFMDSMLKELRNEYFILRRQLAQQRIKIIAFHRVDEYFSDLQVGTAGEDEMLRYSNQALKIQVETLLTDHLNKKMKI